MGGTASSAPVGFQPLVWLDLMTQTLTTSTLASRITRADKLQRLQHPMAPQLAPSQREQIHAMILRELPNDMIAETAECSERGVRRIRSRLRRFGTTTSPPNRVGREAKLTPLMRDALFEQLAKQPGMFRGAILKCRCNAKCACGYNGTLFTTRGGRSIGG